MKFKQGINPNQEFLLPKKPADFLPENHLARAIYEIVNLLGLSKIEEKYSKLGQHAYNPKMMIRLLFYGYAKNVRSSRKISKACEEGFDFAYLADSQKPSHDRISDFRKDNLEELKESFQEIVLIGVNMGLARFGTINASIDGSKLRANASAKLTKDEKSLEKLLETTREEITKILEEAEKTDEEEDKKYGKKNRGDELPKNLQSKRYREQAIVEAYELLKKQKEQMKQKIREDKDREPTEKELKKIDKMKINITDHEAKFMKERNGVIKPSYNCQLSVDEENQLILANNVTDECNDQHQLVPMVEQTKENLGKSPRKVKADNGYHSQLTEATNLFPEIDFYIDDKTRRKDKIDWKTIKEKYDDVEYKNLKKLLTKRGKKEYTKRMHTVEPVIGNIKHNIGYRHFLLRGLKKVEGEFNLMCIAHNLKKIIMFIARSGADLAIAFQNLPKNTNIRNIGRNSTCIKGG